MIKLREIIQKFKESATLHPNINYFGVGPLMEITDNIQSYPYLWVVPTYSHVINFTDENRYRGIELQFALRVGDKVNDGEGYDDIRGLGTNNSLDIMSDTFNTLMDILNSIAENSFVLFDEVRMVDDISIEPFFNEDTGDVTGNMAVITLRIKNYKVCTTPMT
tara:strand:- start:352 stop:840 length:489 start_codon:yes stop_codon:yes gene_type:complete